MFIGLAVKIPPPIRKAGGGTAGPATHFGVSAPSSAPQGTPITFTVTALDAGGNVATSYAGTVHFTSSDGAASLPANSTLTAGTGSFSATLVTSGPQTITATDTVTPGITGTSGFISVVAPATHFLVTAPGTATAGTPISFTVTAKDASNVTVPTYSGTVHFTSADPGATLPADTTLTAGTGTFSATLVTAGNRTITATDTVSSGINGTSGTIAVAAGAATHLSVSAPGTATSGTPITVTVTALDAFNNTATGYAGTVAITSSDGTATLPSSAGLTSGVGTFSVTLNATGTFTVTATDTVSSGITGTSSSIVVSAAAAFPPQVQATNPTIYADFAGNQWWAAGTTQGSFAAWMTATSGTFSRSSTATYLDGGIVKTAASGAARFPTNNSSVAQGIRLTGAVTNLLLWSQDITHAPWSKGPNVTITTGVADPAGGTTAQTITATVSGSFNSQNYVNGSCNISAGQPVTNSIWLRRRTGTGTVSFTDPNGNTQNNVTLTSAWQRFSNTLPSGGSNGFIQIDVLTSGDQIDAWQGQVTQSAFLQDDVPTTSSTATQAADSLSVPFAVAVGDPRTLLAKLSLDGCSAVDPAVGILAAPAGDWYIHPFNSGANVRNGFQMDTSSALFFTVSLVDNSALGLHKICVAGGASGSTRVIDVDGGTAVTDTAAFASTTNTTLTIGAGAHGPAFGNYQIVGGWNVQATPTEATTLSTLP